LESPKVIYKFFILLYQTDELFEKYKGGTKPLQDVTKAEVEEIKSLLLKLLIKAWGDFNNKLLLIRVYLPQ
jgi:hypothetical protein